MELLTLDLLPYAILAQAAHELNEDLTVLVAGAERCCELLEPGDPAGAILSDMLGAAQRVAFLSTDLMVCGVRKSGFPRSVVTVKQLIDGSQVKPVL